MAKRIDAEHGVVCRLATDPCGYFGWPSVTLTGGGALAAVCSGLRARHVCPYGKTVLLRSSDLGRTWSPPEIIRDSPLDDRDAGVISLGGERLLVSLFSSDIREYFPRLKGSLDAEELADWERIFSGWTDDVVARWRGSWVMLSDDGHEWGEPIRVPVSSPHGPIRLAGGDLLYLGKAGFASSDQMSGRIMACRSPDGGRTWRTAGSVPMPEGVTADHFAEPHAVELADGGLLGLIRFVASGNEQFERHEFHLFQTTSPDGGHTWTPAEATGVYGSPPHLLRHSSGVVVCVYGYRRGPFGQRAMFSADGGKTWNRDWVLRDDGPDWDLGYPCSVELPDGSLLTVYYQKHGAGEQCSLLSSRWRIPAV